MTAIELLVWKLTHEDHFGFVDKNRRKLEWVANTQKEDDVPEYGALRAILAYTKQFHKAPPNPTAVRDFIKNSDDFELKIELAAVGEVLAGLDDALGEEGIAKAQAKDIDIWAQVAFDTARKSFHTFVYNTALNIVVAGPSKKGKNEQPSGPDEGVKYIRKMMALDWTEEQGTSGPLNEASQEVAMHLDSIYGADEADRIYMNFPRLDNGFLIGRKFNNFIGLAGFVSRGKSLLARTIAFNAALQGKRVLFVTLEGAGATNVKTQFSFLLGSVIENGGVCPIHKNCKFQMPSYEDIKHKRLTQQLAAHVSYVVANLDNRDLMRGVLTVCDRKTCGNWEAIKERAEQDNYELIIIDYVDILDLPGTKGKDRDFILDALYQEIKSYSELTGRVIVTPLQINREGEKSAASKDPYTEPIHELTHVAKRSTAYQAMDIVLFIYSNNAMKAKGEMKIETRKVREGEYPEDFFAEVAIGGTLLVTELPGMEGKFGKGYLSSTKIAADEDELPAKQPTGDAAVTTRGDVVDEDLEE